MLELNPFNDNKEQQEAKLANGERLALQLAQHLEEMYGASKAVLQVKYKGRTYEVTIEELPKPKGGK